ncbi:PAS domain S-box protein, partial [Candidatus Bipolaricaulota bacterium]|nr:PAS domain S-box protein [Candidatus Bipolaricaulota bacterium]
MKTRDVDMLREHSGVHHLLFKHSTDGLIVFASDSGEIFDCNPQAKMMLGIEDISSRKEKIQSFVPSDDVDNLFGFLKSDGGRRLRKQKIEPRRLPTFFAEMEFYDLDFGGRPAIMCLIEDVTEQKNMEARLKQRAERLNSTNKKLEELIHIISHD